MRAFIKFLVINADWSAASTQGCVIVSITNYISLVSGIQRELSEDSKILECRYSNSTGLRSSLLAHTSPPFRCTVPTFEIGGAHWTSEI